jgi:cytoskeleton protein RodZ
MADNADESGKQAEAEPRAGQRLANARRANGISMRDIAKELHLDEVKVQALEDNRFDVLGAPVFTKGYLRKYAELVHVSIDDVLADYYRMNRATGAPPVVGPKRPKSRTPINPGPWIVGILVLVLLTAAAWWWLNRPPAAALPERSAGGTPQSVPQEPNAESGAENASEADDSNTAQAGGEASGTAALADDSSRPVSSGSGRSAAPEPAPATGSSVPPVAETQLSLRFSGDCWTEVTDGNGSRLFFGLGTAGRNVTVSGVPPIRVLLGDNDNVSLQVNGADYDVAPSELRGNTARLSIGGP